MGKRLTAHDLIAEFKRIESELGRQPTRNEFAINAICGKDQVADVFGTWTEFILAIGKRPLPTGKNGRNNDQKKMLSYDFQSEVVRRWKIELEPFSDRFKFGKKIGMAVTISDSHSQFWDEFTWQVFFDVIRLAQPELIVLGGDILECYDTSFHDKNPRREMNLQSEIDFVVDNKLKKVREICPKAQIDYFAGNHEARIFRNLCGPSAALSSLRNLQFHKLLSLEELEINLVSRPNFIFRPKDQKNADNFKVYDEKWVFTHGTKTGTFPASGEFGKYHLSGASGHVHRFTHVCRRTAHGFQTWVSLGSSCSLETGHEYIPELIDWQRGFLITYFHDGGVTQNHVSTEGGFAEVGGKIYVKAS